MIIHYQKLGAHFIERVLAKVPQSQCKIMLLYRVTTEYVRADRLSASNYCFIRFLVRMMFYETKGMKIQILSKTKVLWATNNKKKLMITSWMSENIRTTRTLRVGILYKL